MRSRTSCAATLLAAALVVTVRAQPAAAQEPECVQPETSAWPFDPQAPQTGTRKVVAILWNPDEAGRHVPTKEEVESTIFGSAPSVKDYFRENSGGRFTLAAAATLGWYRADKPARTCRRRGIGATPTWGRGWGAGAQATGCGSTDRNVPWRPVLRIGYNRPGSISPGSPRRN